MNDHLTRDRIRDGALRRYDAAFDALDGSDIFGKTEIARWVSAAPARQNRRKALRIILAIEAAMIADDRLIRACGLSPVTVKRWRAEIAQKRKDDSGFNTLCAAAIADLRRIETPQQKRNREAFGAARRKAAP